jgi:hypothetical protein
MADQTTIQEPADSESLAKSLLPPFEATVRKALNQGVPLPQRMINEAREEILKLSDLCKRARDLTAEPGGESQEPSIDSGVVLLLLRDFERLRQQVGVEKARQIFRDTLQVFTRAPKGRPKTTPLKTIVAARQMKLAGKSYQRIANELGLKVSQVRTALRYYYPGE